MTSPTKKVLIKDSTSPSKPTGPTARLLGQTSLSKNLFGITKNTTSSDVFQDAEETSQKDTEDGSAHYPDLGLSMEDNDKNLRERFDKITVQNKELRIQQEILARRLAEAEEFNSPDHDNLMNDLHKQEKEAWAKEKEQLLQKVTKDGLSSAIPPTPAATVKNRSAKITDPFVFDGDRKLTRAFTTSMRLKLRGNASDFESEEQKIIYFHSRLGPNAQKHFFPYIKPDGTLTLTSVEEMFNIVTRAWGNTDQKRTSLRELEALRQKNTDFSEFIAEFNRLICDVGYETDSVKIDILHSKLAVEMRQLLVGQDMPEDYYGYVNRIHKLDNDQKSVAPFKTKPSYAPRSYSTPNASTIPTPASFPSTGKRGPITTAEKDRRRGLGLCLYCGLHQFEAGTPCPKVTARDAYRLKLSANQISTVQTLPNDSEKDTSS